ncbi:hypothetical protein B0H14DRAFT_3441600 [Mycena olivaceomarginata]|nr:hypothetical protein B0H14DRAFT_3441600 [Mycena olivaceomarginata]
MNGHNNTRPHMCGFPNCPKSFSVASNVRRHRLIHEKLLHPSPVRPVPPVRVRFTGHIDMPPLLPPPPVSLSPAPFRVRWLPTNATVRDRSTRPTKRSEKKSSASGQIDGSDEQSPMYLFDPFRPPGLRPAKFLT